MKILFVAPHPDDETLGCGGTILKHHAKGNETHWLIVTGISVDSGWPSSKVEKRDDEIKEVSKKYRFSNVHKLNFPTTRVDTLPISDIIGKIVEIYNSIEPDIVYYPFSNDVHTDHQIIAKAMQSSFKWFRFPHIKKVYMYETISETDFNFAGDRIFKPNVFVDISKYLNEKIKIMKIYDGEMGEFPFPRSEQTIRSLALLRGSQSGFKSAEAFELVYEREE